MRKWLYAGNTSDFDTLKDHIESFRAMSIGLVAEFEQYVASGFPKQAEPPEKSSPKH